MKIWRSCLALLALLAGFCLPAQAHQTSLAYVSVSKEGAETRVTLALAFRDLEAALSLDSDFDGQITWGETKARMDGIHAYVATRFALDKGGACTLTPRGETPGYRDGEGFLTLSYDGVCPGTGSVVNLRYALFFDIDPTHRALLHTTLDGLQNTQVLTAGAQDASLQAGEGGTLATLWRFIAEGADHLLSGPDHLLFLFVLILPAIFLREGGARASMWAVLLAVTGFTLGHALTLSAATTGYLRPPARIVEIAIALSVFATAMDNVRPFIRSSRSTVAFAFGLIHGFGFASALGALDLSGGMLAIGLLGFNIGIELAQIALVLAVFPILYAVREPAARWKIMPLAASLAVAALALWWTAMRVIA